MKQTELPKVLYYIKGKVSWEFVPTLIQHENDGCENAYYAMYAKRIVHRDNCHNTTVNVGRVLFWVCAPTAAEAWAQLCVKYEDYKKYISGRTWDTSQPVQILDLSNAQSWTLFGQITPKSGKNVKN